MTNFDNKVLKKKKLADGLNLKITQNEMSGRIFVEFSSENGKLVLQKSFQDTFEGNKDAQKFSKKFKTLNDLRKHFGLPQILYADRAVVTINGEKVLDMRDKK